MNGYTGRVYYYDPRVKNFNLKATIQEMMQDFASKIGYNPVILEIRDDEIIGEDLAGLNITIVKVHKTLTPYHFVLYPVNRHPVKFEGVRSPCPIEMSRSLKKSLISKHKK